METKISIVTVTYNCASLIEATLESILQQDYPHLELLVIDGGSTDGTLEIVERYRDHIAVLISEKDKGIYDAMNKGIRHATGEWLFFLNAGDVFCRASTVSDVFRSSWEGCAAVYGDIYEMRRGKPYLWRALRPFWTVEKGFFGMGFSHQGVFLRTAIAKANPFDLNFRCCADYNQMMSVHRQGGRFAYCGATIATVLGNEGFSADNVYTQKREEALISGSLNTCSYYVAVWNIRIRRFVKRCLGIQ